MGLRCRPVANCLLSERRPGKDSARWGMVDTAAIDGSGGILPVSLLVIPLATRESGLTPQFFFARNLEHALQAQ